ncbi:hypothetical protein [Chitinophaga cymbidii]|uniref:Uncharacterized protein n=1 Tax=Chitinophaga cymbidii TaxID=1096750 RepID=A0A512RQR3_9BACT|nr:hypothetical protein [Chitinophaga cymbidii]GEP98024.1 hypothetical protein CCY01nite_42840 [Chitinophaga cymbidii]
MKSCIIYKTFKDEYKIVAQCETSAGYLLAVTPVFIIPVNCSDEDLFSTILKVLNNSTEKVKAPARDDFPELQKKMLIDLQEKSFTKLYTGSTSCEIRVKDKILCIYPNTLLTAGKPRDGLSWIEEDKVVIEENAVNVDNLVLQVKELLGRKYY